MRKSRFTEAQIVAIVREYDAGTAVAPALLHAVERRVGEFQRGRPVDARAHRGRVGGGEWFLPWPGDSPLRRLGLRSIQGS